MSEDSENRLSGRVGKHHTIEEDVEPQRGPTMSVEENIKADDGEKALSKVDKRKEAHDRTRNGMAWSMVVVLIVVIGVGGYGWLHGRDISRWGSFSAPLFTLAGTALAFYFSKSGKK